MFPKSPLDMSLRLPYIGEQDVEISERDTKKARSRSPRYFSGYPVSIVDLQRTDASDIEKQSHICAFCNGLLRSAVQLIPCGHRSCKNCHDFRILIGKEKTKSSEDKFCRSCQEEDKETQESKPENQYRWLFIESFKDRAFEKMEAKRIFIKHCPIKNCTTWTGQTLQDLYKHEKENHGFLEQQQPALSDADIRQSPLYLKVLKSPTETAQSSKKKRKKHKKPKNISAQQAADSKATKQEKVLATSAPEARKIEAASQLAEYNSTQKHVKHTHTKMVVLTSVKPNSCFTPLSPTKAEPLLPGSLALQACEISAAPTQPPLDLSALDPLGKSAQCSQKQKTKKKVQKIPDQTISVGETVSEERELTVTTTDRKRNEATFPTTESHCIRGNLQDTLSKAGTAKSVELSSSSQIQSSKGELLLNQSHIPLTGAAAKCSRSISFIESLAMGHRTFDVPPEISLLRKHFQSYIIDAIKHQPAAVVFIGSMAFHLQIKDLWGEYALTQITPEGMPDGVFSNPKMSLKRA